jgi:hypothetical protein
MRGRPTGIKKKITNKVATKTKREKGKKKRKHLREVTLKFWVKKKNSEHLSQMKCSNNNIFSYASHREVIERG